VTQNRFHKFDVYGHTLATLDGARGDVVVKLGALLHDVGKPRSRAPKEDAPGEYSFFRHEFVGAEMATGICQRLKLSNEQREDVTALVRHHMFYYEPQWTDGKIRRFVREIGVERLAALFALRAADIRGRGYDEDPEKETRELKERIDRVAAEDAALHIKDLAIDGGDVMRILGIPPGRQVGQILGRLLERVIDDPALNTREALEALVRAELPAS
jgi:tRNA nucleotidyltransferase (CCA-adding enzyme)